MPALQQAHGTNGRIAGVFLHSSLQDNTKRHWSGRFAAERLTAARQAAIRRA
jgi:hypothetical protein